jgi:6-phospho-beta-glucosidase
MSNRKVALIGGGGVRTPLVIFGVNESSRHLGVDEMVLYDLDTERANVMCELGRALIAREGGTLKLRVAKDLEDAISDASFVLTAIRVGGIQARAVDERISIDNGYPRAGDNRPWWCSHGPSDRGGCDRVCTLD